MPGQNPLQPPDLQILKMADQTEQVFFHFTDVYLRAHLDGVNAKFVQLRTHLPCFCIYKSFVVSLVTKWNNRSAHFCIQCALRLFHFFTNETTKINYQFLIEADFTEQ